MKNEQAFTLIELLVVVLIIGILSAVALPQYQKAVEKSKAVQALTLLQAIWQAEEAYKIANGEYAIHFEDLDVDIPWTGNQSAFSEGNYFKDVRSNEDWSIQSYSRDSQFQIFMGRLSGRYKGAGFIIADNLPTDQTERTPGKTECIERTSYGNVLYNGTAGSYCHDIFRGTLTWNGLTRVYSLP